MEMSWIYEYMVYLQFRLLNPPNCELFQRCEVATFGRSVIRLTVVCSALLRLIRVSVYLCKFLTISTHKDKQHEARINIKLDS